MPRYYWEQCYELEDIHWALCDDESAKSGRVTDHHLVLIATYPVCCDGRPLSEQPMPALIIELLNGEHGKALTEKSTEIEHLRTQLAAAEAASPMQKLTEEIQSDDDYAWGWHCNITMSFFGQGATHEQANRAAARFMRTAFEIDVTQFDQWKSFPWVGEKQQMSDEQPKAQEKDGIVADLKAQLAAAEAERNAAKGIQIEYLNRNVELREQLATARGLLREVIDLMTRHGEESADGFYIAFSLRKWWMERAKKEVGDGE